MGMILRLRQRGIDAAFLAENSVSCVVQRFIIR